MACIDDRGTLSPAARAFLEALRGPATPEEAAETLGLSLYRIRASVRELVAAGLVEERDGTYALTAEGRVRIAESPGL
jgi:predicted transcriptional regulator